MTYLETKLTESNLFNKISLQEIERFYITYGFYEHGMKNVLEKLGKNNFSRYLNSHDADNLQISDQIYKGSTNYDEVYVPFPTNLLTALVFIRRTSYLFLAENGLKEMAKDNELIPVMIESLFINEIYKPATKAYIDAYYHNSELQPSNYIKELIKLSGQYDRKQYNDFSTAYALQDEMTNYYTNNTKQFYKILDKYQKIESKNKQKEESKKEEINYYELVTIVKKENEKNQKKKIKRR